MCPFPGSSTHSAGSEFFLCHTPKGWVTKHTWIVFQHQRRVFPDSSQLANFILHGRDPGRRAFPPRLLKLFVSHIPSVFVVRLVLLVKAGHRSCQQWVNTVVSKTLQSFSSCLQCAYPAAAACGGIQSGSSLETFQHPSACGTTQEELHNTSCLHTQSARSFMVLLSAFIRWSALYIQPLRILTDLSLSSLLSLVSWHNTVSNSPLNPKKLPSANDYGVALLVACTVSPLTVFTSCVAISLAWLN